MNEKKLCCKSKGVRTGGRGKKENNLSEGNILASVFIFSSSSSLSFPTNVSDRWLGAKLGDYLRSSGIGNRSCCLLSLSLSFSLSPLAFPFPFLFLFSFFSFCFPLPLLLFFSLSPPPSPSPFPCSAPFFFSLCSPSSFPLSFPREAQLQAEGQHLGW